MPLSRDRLEHLVARSTDIVVATDRDGNVAYYNDGASRILGYAPDEILGKYVGILYPDLGAAILDGLAYLEVFPYGCVEQTLSRFVPAAIARRAVKDLNLPATRVPAQLDDMVEFLKWTNGVNTENWPPNIEG